VTIAFEIEAFKINREARLEDENLQHESRVLL
jgi:hypothetical protein